MNASFLFGILISGLAIALGLIMQGLPGRLFTWLVFPSVKIIYGQRVEETLGKKGWKPLWLWMSISLGIALFPCLQLIDHFFPQPGPTFQFLVLWVLLYVWMSITALILIPRIAVWKLKTVQAGIIKDSSHQEKVSIAHHPWLKTGYHIKVENPQNEKFIWVEVVANYPLQDRSSFDLLLSHQGVKELGLTGKSFTLNILEPNKLFAPTAFSN